MKMDDRTVFVGDKPLETLRVVDLKQELKKRGIRSSGTKLELQKLLHTAIISESECAEAHETTAPLVASNDDNFISNNSITNTDKKVASVSINEEKETIKITIRSSPRKSEPVPLKESESEESQSSENSEEINEKTEKNVINEESLPSQDESKSVSPSNNNNLSTNKQIEIVEQPKPELKMQTVKETENSSTISAEKENVSKLSSVTKTENKMPVKADDNDSKLNNSTLKEKLSLPKSLDETETLKPAQKKRRWCSSQTDVSSVLKKGISSDKLKQLINDAENGTSTKGSKTSIENNSQEIVVDEPKIETNLIKDLKTKKIDISFKNNEITKIVQNENSIVEKADNNNNVRSISPAKNPESTVLFITGLVRPYTLVQLKKLLSNSGQIDEEKFWIDKIKSKCYVTYSKIEEAVETRKALHNLKWPQSSPKNLCVEFATLEDIDRCMHPENYEDLPMKTEKRKLLEDKDINKGKYDLKEHKIDMEKNIINNNNNKADIVNRGIKEWDRDKIAVKHNRQEKDENTKPIKKPRYNSPPPPPPSSSNREKYSKTEESRPKPERIMKKEESIPKKSKSPSPIRLEDLFRKTKTIPSIYWLPLTEDEANEREKERVQMEKERQIRISQRMEMASRRSPRPSRTMNRPRSPPRKRFRPYTPPRRSRYSRSPDRRRYSPRRR